MSTDKCTEFIKFIKLTYSVTCYAFFLISMKTAFKWRIMYQSITKSKVTLCCAKKW